jgi:hypothetical protein
MPRCCDFSPCFFEGALESSLAVEALSAPRGAAAAAVLPEPQPQPDHDVAGKAAAAAEGAEAAATKIQAGSRGMMSRNK